VVRLGDFLDSQMGFDMPYMGDEEMDGNDKEMADEEESEQDVAVKV